MKQSNSIRKKEAPNKLKYKLPSAVRTLVIYFCRGGILIVKWKGLKWLFRSELPSDFLFLLFPVFQQRHQSRDWRKRIFSIIPDDDYLTCVLWHSSRKNCFCWLFDWWVETIPVFIDTFGTCVANQNQPNGLDNYSKQMCLFECL